MVKIINTVEGLSLISSEWERLAENPEMRIFQTYDWSAQAISCMGMEPYVMYWRQDGRPDTVICSFCLDARGCLREMGAVSKSENARYWNTREAVTRFLDAIGMTEDKCA